MTEDNIEIGICNSDGFRRLSPQARPLTLETFDMSFDICAQEVKDYLANIQQTLEEAKPALQYKCCGYPCEEKTLSHFDDTWTILIVKLQLPLVMSGAFEVFKTTPTLQRVLKQDKDDECYREESEG